MSTFPKSIEAKDELLAQCVAAFACVQKSDPRYRSMRSTLTRLATREIVLMCPKIKWDLTVLVQHDWITEDFVFGTGFRDLAWKKVSYQISIKDWVTPEVIARHPKFEWHWSAIVCNKTSREVHKDCYYYNDDSEEEEGEQGEEEERGERGEQEEKGEGTKQGATGMPLSAPPADPVKWVTPQIVLANSYLHPLLEFMSHQAWVTFDLVLRYSTHPWDWKVLSRSKQIATRENVFTHRHLNWSLDEITCHTWVTAALVEECFDFKWSWAVITRKAWATQEFVLAHPHWPWDPSALTSRTWATMNFITAHPSLPWDWDIVTTCKKPTIKDILANPDKPWKLPGFA